MITPDRFATVVLVHGNFLGPWSWHEVSAVLEGHGLPTVVADLPSGRESTDSAADLYADANEIRTLLERATSPVLLCGHSYGGAVITEAAAGPHPSVGRLVYLAGAAPDTGESLASLSPAPEPPPATEASEAGERITVRPDGRIELTAESAEAALFHDCSSQRADLAIRQLRPSNPDTGSQPVRGAAWRQIPSTYVRCGKDRMPELASAAFLASADEIVDLPTGHCPNWSAPQDVAELLRRLVRH